MPPSRDGDESSPDSGSALPVDLGAALAFTALTVAAATLPGVRETPIRVGLGLAFALFVPGYVSVAALFPEAATRADEATDQRNQDPDRGRDGVGPLERVVLSFGLSVAIVPLVVLGLNFTPWGIGLDSVLAALTAFVAVAAGVAVVRRRQLPPGSRFVVRPQARLRTLRAELLEPPTRTDAGLNVLVICALLLATGSVAFAVATPTGEESFTTFSLLTENESGALVADDYPTTFERGEPESVVVSVSNHEGGPVRYTVVTELQRVRTGEDTTRVTDETEIARFSTRIEASGTWRRTVSLAPEMTGDRLRLQFLLYRGDAPATPSDGTAYRELHLWVAVSPTDDSDRITVEAGESTKETPLYGDRQDSYQRSYAT